MPAGGVERDRSELSGDGPGDVGGREGDDEVRGQVALRVDDGPEAESGQVLDRRLHDLLVGPQVRPDEVELADLGEQDGAGQLGHPEIQAKEGTIGVLRAESIRGVALVVDREHPTVEVLVVGDDHPAVAARDRLVFVEAVDAGRADAAHPLALVGRAERLRAVLDDGDAVAIRDILEFIESGRRTEHMHDDDRPSPRRDPRLDIGRIEVERIVDLRQDRERAGVDDRRDRCHVREAGNDDLVAGADAQAHERHQQSARAAAAQPEAEADAGQPRDVLLDLPDLGPEIRVVLPAVSAQRTVGEDLHHFRDLFLADQLDAWAWHASFPFSTIRVVQPIALDPTSTII